MNTVNETKTFSSLPEEESALWERMRDTLLCLQTDNSISVKNLASRLAYSTQEFLYLADIFFDNSLDTIREQVQGLNIEEDYTNQVLPFERIPDSSMIEYKVVRRMAQTVEADMLPLEGDVFQNGMEYIEKDVKEKWKERERAGEYMQFWWHDDSYHFFYMIGQEVPKDAGKESEKKWPWYPPKKLKGLSASYSTRLIIPYSQLNKQRTLLIIKIEHHYILL